MPASATPTATATTTEADVRAEREPEPEPKREPKPEPERPREPKAGRIVLALVAAASAAPLLFGRHLPFTDLPEHVAVASSLAHWNDPAYRVAEHYALAFPKTPYVLFHVVVAAIAILTRDPEIAARILLVAIAIALPFSLRSLLDALGADRRLAVLAPLLFWNRALVLGLLPFVASIPVLVFAVATVVRATSSRSVKARAILAVLGVVLFYLHVSSFLVFVVTAIALALTTRGVRAIRETWWLLPSAALSVLWIASGRITAHGSAFLEREEVSYATPARAFALFPLWLHDIWQTHADEALAILWWASVVLLAVASMRAREGSLSGMKTRLVPLAAVLAVFLATPHRAGVGLFLNERLAPLLALFAIPILRPPPRAILTRIGLASAVVATLAASVVAIREISAADREEMAGFDALIGVMRPGARVVALNFDRRSRHAQFAPWLHVAAYHRIRRGGVNAYSFTGLEHWPLRYTDAGAPPARPSLARATSPCLFRNSVDGLYFDYVLTRGARDPFANAPPGPRWRSRGQAAAFTLYEKTAAPHAAGGPPEDRGPCSD
ncbi:MAG: hypothetical protein KF850_24565 [Labilithrix sp.]|nr:hypothetical protein [Labilithrix sp.]